MSHPVWRKPGAFILKSCQEDGTFSGYASFFDHKDHHHERVQKGAFEKSLKQGASAIKMLWQHDTQQPIGVWHTLKEDARGLYVEGRLLTQVQKGYEAYVLMKEGILQGLSIGGQVISAEKCTKGGERILTEVGLQEISLVTFPANQKAIIHRVKQSHKAPCEDLGIAERSQESVNTYLFEGLKEKKERLRQSLEKAIAILSQVSARA